MNSFLRLPFLRQLLIAGGFALVAHDVSIAADQQGRLNLISIVTDDQAHWSIGAYGNKESRTPNMDRLAREGARFLNAFTCTPVCSPSRASFLTGRYGTQLGITDWITQKEGRIGVGLPSNTMTGEQPPSHPTKLGFDYFMGSPQGSFRPRNPELEVDGRKQTVDGFSADVVMDAALKFVDTNRASPFALLIHFREPHLPYDPVAESDSAPFKDLDPTIPDFPNLKTNQVKKWTRLYYGAIHAVDRNLGRLLVRLDELKLSERTIVMFTSDHGYMIGHHGLHTKGNAHWVAGGSNGPKRPNMFEESLRIPLIVRGPDVERGIEISQFISNIDTYASVLALLGIEQPAGWKQEGIDFSPLLRGQPINTHDAIFGQYDLHNGGLAFMRSIRTAQWKLVRHYFSDSLDELYDLQADPGELKNLYDDDKSERVRNELQAKLTAWQRSINDPVLRQLNGK